MAKPLSFIADAPVFGQIGRILNSAKTVSAGISPTSPQKKLMFQAATLSMVALISMSLTPGGTYTASSFGYNSDYIDSYGVGDVLVADVDGYLVKMNPQTDASNRAGLTDFAIHTVNNGEALSVIAEQYGVNVSTIMWENKLSNAHSVRIGQKLLIPPVDGISYEVQSGDSITKIAKKYKIDTDGILSQNSLETEVIAKGQSLFLPGAEPIVVAPTAIARAPSSTRSTARSLSGSSNAPSAGKVFIFPTNGKITQGFQAGHYAFDIADRSRPPIWAAGGGTIVKVSTGTWGGGYGNHVIIDHGNGLQTLYAHMSDVYAYVGQQVSQGDVVGVMGNTGRVYGVTGIHLHWEVSQNGVKQYPGNYY
ncbi:MAG: M23 family metallopeptidase [Lutibacter sp.]|nr:M23 family metallopeptidase [Lutibacter sp.]